jgi:hypothetical protein
LKGTPFDPLALTATHTLQTEMAKYLDEQLPASDGEPILISCLMAFS